MLIFFPNCNTHLCLELLTNLNKKKTYKKQTKQTNKNPTKKEQTKQFETKSIQDIYPQGDGSVAVV